MVLQYSVCCVVNDPLYKAGMDKDSSLEEQCCAEPKIGLVVKVHQSGVNDVAVTPGKHSLHC